MMDAPKKKIGFKTFQNVLLLGVAGLGAWWAWNHIVSPSMAGSGGGKSDPAPDLNGPPVTAGKIAVVLSNKCISQRDPQFVYTPIFATLSKIDQVIKSPVTGRFTGRMLCNGKIKFAEIYKT